MDSLDWKFQYLHHLLPCEILTIVCSAWHKSFLTLHSFTAMFYCMINAYLLHPLLMFQAFRHLVGLLKNPSSNWLAFKRQNAWNLILTFHINSMKKSVRKSQKKHAVFFSICYNDLSLWITSYEISCIIYTGWRTCVPMLFLLFGNAKLYKNNIS